MKLREVWVRIWQTLAGGRRDRDLEAELAAHVELAEDELRGQGYSREEAGRLARVKAGNSTQAVEGMREQRGIPALSAYWLDIKLGLRMLRKSWGLTLVGGVAMMVTIGLCATIFVILGTVRGGELPLPEGERVVTLAAFDLARTRSLTSFEHFEQWRASLRTVQDIAAFQTIERELITPDGSVTHISVARMTSPGFRAARVQPILGRFLLEEDERAGAERVVVIGYSLWQSRFAGDPTVLGRTIRIGGLEHVVAGVMPEGFAFPVNHQAWTTMGSIATEQRIRVFGRLAPGVSLETSRAEFAAIAAHDQNTPLLTRLNPYAASFGLLIGNNDPWIYRVIPVLLALLLIPPCANIAILIYARNVTRAEEFAARYVLGAGRVRIAGQLVVETLVLAALAGCAGLLMTHGLLAWVKGYAAQDAELRSVLPYWMTPSLSLEVILYVAGLVMFAALIASGVPALRVTGRIVNTGFQGLGSRSGGLRLSRTWIGLVVVQVALSMAVLPVAADLVVASLTPTFFGPGFPASEYLTAQVSMDQPAPRFHEIQLELARALEAEGGVRGVTLSSGIPQVEPSSMIETNIPALEAFQATRNDVDPAYFKLFAAPLLTGRPFEPADFNPGRPCVLVTREFVEKLGPGVNPLGLRVRAAASDEAEPGPWFEVVGVVSDFSSRKSLPKVYYAMRRDQQSASVNLTLRIGPSIPSGMAPRLQQMATRIDPGLRVEQLRTLDAAYREARLEERIAGLGLAVVFLIVLSFSVAGIYTLAAFVVAQRRREIAIRVAIGARPGRLVADIFGRTLFPVMAGAALGAALSIYISRVLEAKSSALGLFSVEAILIVISLLSVAGPARRALRIDATEVLRES